MNILLTGSTGFIGSYVLNQLIQDTDSIIYVVVRNHRDSLISSERIKYIFKDIGEFRFDDIPVPIDSIIHLAWVDVSRINEDSHMKHLRVQKSFIKECIKLNPNKILISGTCFEYGIIEGELFPYTKTQPVTEYGKAKDAFRLYLQEMWQDSSLKIELKWLRIFYTYGEGQHEKSLFSLLNNAVKMKDKSFDMSNGHQIRDFISVNELAQRIVAYNQQESTPGFEISNLCSGTPISILDLVQHWCNDLGSKIILNRGVYSIPSHEPIAFWGNPSSAIRYF
jgi:nucleoside-diphosphate-sugar epimerase